MANHLLVPGTGGNKLLLNGQDMGWPVALQGNAWLAGNGMFEAITQTLGLSSAEEIVRTLSMRFGDPEDPQPLSTTLAAGEVTPGPLLHLVYNQLQGIDAFLYDWRSDIRDSGRRLLEFLKANKPSNRWKLVGHSQGGLVIVMASKLCALENDDDETAFSSLVSEVILLGTPLMGTIRAVDGIARGNELTGAFSDHFREIARTWPSLFQMLPAWHGALRRADAPDQPTGFGFFDPRAWAGYAIDSSMLERGAKARSLLQSPLSRMRGVQSRIVMSSAYPTWDHLLLGPSGLVFPKPKEEGDGLVPFETTYANLGDMKAFVHCFGKNGNTAAHSMLANDPVLASYVRKFLG